MHELSVCLSLLSQVERIAHEYHATHIDRIIVKIGPLSGIEPDLLRNAYPLAATGTLAENAELVIGETEIRIRCSDCGTESTVVANRLLCPACSNFRTSLLSGDEMILQSVELRSHGDTSNSSGDGVGDRPVTRRA